LALFSRRLSQRAVRSWSPAGENLQKTRREQVQQYSVQKLGLLEQLVGAAG